MKKVPKLGERKRLVKNLLLLDGISRSGKFILANILNGLEDVEPVQYSGVVEHIPYLAHMGLMDKRAAGELLHHEIDLHCYEMLLGRNINHRKSDKSAIYNVANHASYLVRAGEEDTEKALNEFYKRGAYSLFITHESLPTLKVFFNSFPDMRVVSLERSPVDLAHAWFTRYRIDAWGTDEKFFPLVFKGNKSLMPWFMVGKEKTYESLRGADRAIFMIERLFDLYAKARMSFSPTERKKVYFVRYEDILENTDSVVAGLSRFLEKEVTGDMKDILRRLRLPNPQYSTGKKDQRLLDLSKAASPTMMTRLHALEKAYLSRRSR